MSHGIITGETEISGCQESICLEGCVYAQCMLDLEGTEFASLCLDGDEYW